MKIPWGKAWSRNLYIAENSYPRDMLRIQHNLTATCFSRLDYQPLFRKWARTLPPGDEQNRTQNSSLYTWKDTSSLSPILFRGGVGGGGASVHRLLKERWKSSLSFCCLSFFSSYSYLESWRTWTHFSWPLRGWTTETGSVLWRNALWGLFWESYRLFDWLLRVFNGRLGQKCP